MMSNRPRSASGGENALLGMIVDRSSFDYEDDLTQTHSDDEGSTPIKRRNGKVRRKLRWKPAAFRSSRKSKASTASSNESILTDGSKSLTSFHTFHSTETPVMGNKKSIKTQQPLARPNYRDTFDGVATIDSEGGYVHSRMQAQNSGDRGLPRSQTVPSKQGYSFEAFPADGTAPTNEFDPYGPESPQNPMRFKKKKLSRQGRPPMAPPSYHQQHVVKTTSTTSPVSVVLPQKEPRASSPILVDTSTSTMSTSMETSVETSLPTLSMSDFEKDRQIGMFAESSSSTPTPTRSRSTSPPIVTPTKPQFTPESKKRSAKNRAPTPSPRKSTNSPRVSPSNSPSTVPTDKINKSGIFSGRRGGSGKRYNRAVDSTSPEKVPSPPSPTMIRGRRDRITVTATTTTTTTTTTRSSTSPPRTRTPSPRSRTGPVDIDDGSFLEADRNLNAIHQMAAEHLAHGEYDEALEVFEEILRGQRERFGPSHFRVGTALHNIGIVHLKARNYEAAVEVCQEAVRVRKETLEANHPDIAVSLAQLGVAHLESQQYRDALIAFRAALEIRRECLGPRHPKVGKILNNVGCALFELDEMEGAELAFEEALEIQRETLRGSPPLVDESGSTNQSLLSIASSLCNLGSIRLRKEEYEDASVALEEALLIQQSVLGDEHPTVLATMENISYVDNARNSTSSNPLTKMANNLGCGTSPNYMPTSSATTFEAQEGKFKCDPSPRIDTSENFNLSKALGMIRPKQWYEQVEQAAKEKGCVGGGGTMSLDDETSAGDSSVRDLDKDNRVEV